MDTVEQDRPLAPTAQPKVRRSGWTRVLTIAQRYFIPRFVASAYFYFKHGCLVSTSSRVQFSSLVTLGKGTVVKPYAIIQTNTGRISIGRDCAISSFNHISTNTADVVLGDYVRLGPNVTIMGSRREYKDRNVNIVDQGYSDSGVVIGNDVLIGAGAIIVDGCRIGDGAVVVAGSMVTKDIAPYSIVAGMPARSIGQRQ